MNDPLQVEPLTVLEQLDIQDVAFLDDRIYDFNVARTGITDGRLLVIVLRDTNPGFLPPFRFRDRWDHRR